MRGVPLPEVTAGLTLENRDCMGVKLSRLHGSSLPRGITLVLTQGWLARMKACTAPEPSTRQATGRETWVALLPFLGSNEKRAPAREDNFGLNARPC